MLRKKGWRFWWVFFFFCFFRFWFVCFVFFGVGGERHLSWHDRKSTLDNRWTFVFGQKKRTFANLVLKGNNFCWIRGGLCKKSCIFSWTSCDSKRLMIYVSSTHPTQYLDIVICHDIPSFVAVTGWGVDPRHNPYTCSGVLLMVQKSQTTTWDV